MTALVEINTISNYTYFAGNFTKGKSWAGAILYFKNDFKVSKILKYTVFDISFKKCYIFALNLQSTLSFKEIRQGKTKKT